MAARRKKGPPIPDARFTFGGAPLDDAPASSLFEGLSRAPAAKAPARQLPPATTRVRGARTDFESGSAQEVKDLQADFAEKKAREEARLDLRTDASFWGGLVFVSNDDLNTFLDALQERGLAREAIDDQWIDGYAVARLLGIPLDPPAFDPPNVNVLDLWRDVAIEPGALKLSDDEPLDDV